ncbi:MAG: undecaprenyldiphospho-muramoylpentapeptide beta-N-acetylglucosaminyltransferase [Myxococcales bacterium]|nr:undecaprenyldiphospho-muramoylpentapeptide beta-N-acetylglucosaminyltransferase [Myxococcales bacterium]
MNARSTAVVHLESHVADLQHSKRSLPLRIVIAGGGTGGHLYPGIAIAEAFKQHDPRTDVRFIGSTTGIEAQVLPREGWQSHLLPASRLRGGGPWVFARGAAKIPVGIASCIRFFLDFRPQLVIGVGGYASGAAMLAAALCDIPRVIQEQNTIPGMTNRITARLSERVYANQGVVSEWFGDTPIRTFGTPIRHSIRESLLRARGQRLRPTAGSPFRILVVGGSQGAQFLNQQVPELVTECIRRSQGIAVVHQTGVKDLDTTRKEYEKRNISADVRAYINDMAEAYTNADLILCRAGASTLAEITAVGLPALLVPFPFAAYDHQTANAHTLQRAGAARVVEQSRWETAHVADIIVELATHPLQWSQMAKRSLEIGNPDAANQIVNDCIELLSRLDR